MTLNIILIVSGLFLYFHVFLYLVSSLSLIVICYILIQDCVFPLKTLAWNPKWVTGSPDCGFS
jgi:hypothetical protein